MQACLRHRSSSRRPTFFLATSCMLEAEDKDLINGRSRYTGAGFPEAQNGSVIILTCCNLGHSRKHMLEISEEVFFF